MQRMVLSFITGFAALITTAVQAQDLGPLIMPAELASGEVAQDPIIIDIRDEGYDKGHIEGAVWAPYRFFRGPTENPGAVPPFEELHATYELLGLELEEPVIIVSQGDSDTDFGAAARVYWTLKSSGFTNLSILNGGATAWVNAGYPISTVEETRFPSELNITWNDAWTADTDAVARVVTGEDRARLIDARPVAFFEGKKAHGAASSPGTLPGAQNLPYTEFFRPGATAISADGDVAALKAKLGIETGETLVSFCNTGHWAATEWFALSELAQIENVKLYPGSMVEYSQSGGEIENRPGLFANFIRQITGQN